MRKRITLGIFFGSLLVSAIWSSLSFAEHAETGYGGNYSTGGSSYSFPAGTCDPRGGGQSFAAPQTYTPPTPTVSTPDPAKATQALIPPAAAKPQAPPAAAANPVKPVETKVGNPEGDKKPADQGAGGSTLSGADIAAKKCASCHDGKGQARLEDIKDGVLAAVGPGGDMPKGGTKLTEEEIAALKTHLGL